MAGNRNLNDSAKNKLDEFYTQLSMIESELKHYKEHFRGKVILCNCDDPFESNFFKYFAMNFNVLGLKKLISTCYASSIISYTQLDLFGNDTTVHMGGTKPYKVEITEANDENGDGRIDLEDIEILLNKKDPSVLSLLNGNGDFRSDECIALLDEADIVVTNPPFSLFREYVAQLIEHDKEFLIIGNINNVKYKEILPLFMQDKVWLGYNSGHFWFRVPDSYDEKKTDFKIEDGIKWRRMGNICWFTNLDITKRHEDMTLFKTYSPEKYPKYDNYDAIEVSSTADIPCDYYGQMGVPITFMTRYNPSQFEILGVLNSGSGNEYDYAKAILKGKQLYARILIKRRKVE